MEVFLCVYMKSHLYYTWNFTKLAISFFDSRVAHLASKHNMTYCLWVIPKIWGSRSRISCKFQETTNKLGNTLLAFFLLSQTEFYMQRLTKTIHISVLLWRHCFEINTGWPCVCLCPPTCISFSFHCEIQSGISQCRSICKKKPKKVGPVSDKRGWLPQNWK